MKLIVSHKNSYGRDFFYPESPDADMICKVLDQKCFSKKQLLIAKENGWEVHLKNTSYQLDENLKIVEKI